MLIQCYHLLQSRVLLLQLWCNFPPTFLLSCSDLIDLFIFLFILCSSALINGFFFVFFDVSITLCCMQFSAEGNAVCRTHLKHTTARLVESSVAQNVCDQLRQSRDAIQPCLLESGVSHVITTSRKIRRFQWTRELQSYKSPTVFTVWFASLELNTILFILEAIDWYKSILLDFEGQKKVSLPGRHWPKRAAGHSSWLRNRDSLNPFWKMCEVSIQPQ